jgi:hypothetical protein
MKRLQELDKNHHDEVATLEATLETSRAFRLEMEHLLKPMERERRLWAKRAREEVGLGLFMPSGKSRAGNATSFSWYFSEEMNHAFGWTAKSKQRRRREDMLEAQRAVQMDEDLKRIWQEETNGESAWLTWVCPFCLVRNSYEDEFCTECSAACPVGDVVHSPKEWDWLKETDES